MSETPKTGLFSCKSPCGNCPYRTDAPLQLWDRSEFKRLLSYENDPLGAVYMCHKQNGSACVGWLIKQHEADLPSVMLRLALTKLNPGRAYLDSLKSPAPLYKSVREMIKFNYPDLLKK